MSCDSKGVGGGSLGKKKKERAIFPPKPAIPSCIPSTRLGLPNRARLLPPGLSPLGFSPLLSFPSHNPKSRACPPRWATGTESETFSGLRGGVGGLAPEISQGAPSQSLRAPPAQHHHPPSQPGVRARRSPPLSRPPPSLADLPNILCGTHQP